MTRKLSRSSSDSEQERIEFQKWREKLRLFFKEVARRNKEVKLNVSRSSSDSKRVEIKVQDGGFGLLKKITINETIDLSLLPDNLKDFQKQLEKLLIEERKKAIVRKSLTKKTELIHKVFYSCDKCPPKGKSSRKGKQKSSKRREKVSPPYPSFDKTLIKTFQIKYEKKLSAIAKFILNSFQKKYLYYAIDDILYLFKSNPLEQENLLTVLYSPVLSLQNNFFINFFDIWIDEIYIHEISKVNKFLINDFQNREQFNYITIRLRYKLSEPIKKSESLW